MTLQKIIFPNVNVPQELYFRKMGNTLSFDTYFNSFSIEKWKKYTKLKTLYLEIESREEVKVEFYNKKITNGKVESVLIKPKSEGRNVFKINIEEITEGIISFDINQEDVKKIKSISYKTSLSYGNVVKLGVVVCTYKREEYIKNLIDIFNKILLDNKINNKIDFYIIDNAQSLNLKTENDKIKIIKNKNYGGAGGFTRGIIESMNNDCTNILLMDDDVEIEEEVIKKLFNFLKLLKKEYSEYFISGGMLLKEQMNIQHELTGKWKLYKNENLRGNKNLSDIKEVLLNEIEHDEKMCYGAWWFCSFSKKNVLKNGLPFPFFIKGDDIEFSLRNSSKIITLNGLSVWHEDFQKKYSSFLYYYTMRNNILINILIEKVKYNRVKLFFNLMLRYSYNILKFRKNELRLMRRALEDLNKGSNFFKEMKPDVYHQEIISLNKQNASFFFEFYKTIKVIVKTLVFFGKIQNDYRKNKGEFFSVEFWKNYLEM